MGRIARALVFVLLVWLGLWASSPGGCERGEVKTLLVLWEYEVRSQGGRRAMEFLGHVGVTWRGMGLRSRCQGGLLCSKIISFFSIEGWVGAKAKLAGRFLAISRHENHQAFI